MLQYQWATTVSEASGQRMQASLLPALHAVGTDFKRELASGGDRRDVFQELIRRHPCQQGRTQGRRQILSLGESLLETCILLGREVHEASWIRSHERAIFQSRFTVFADTLKRRAASSQSRPPK